MRITTFTIVLLNCLYLTNAHKLIENCATESKRRITISEDILNSELQPYCEECEEGYTLQDNSRSCIKTSLKLRFTQSSSLQYCLNQQQVVDLISCDYQAKCSSTQLGPNQYLCSNCQVVDQLSNCISTKVCNQRELFSFSHNRCLYFCYNGILAYNQSSCGTSEICQDGLEWNSLLKMCTYTQCDNHRIAYGDTLCTASRKCSENYYYNEKTQSCLLCNNSLRNYKYQTQCKLYFTHDTSSHTEFFYPLTSMSYLMAIIYLLILAAFIIKCFPLRRDLISKLLLFKKNLQKPVEQHQEENVNLQENQPITRKKEKELTRFDCHKKYSTEEEQVCEDVESNNTEIQYKKGLEQNQKTNEINLV